MRVGLVIFYKESKPKYNIFGVGVRGGGEGSVAMVSDLFYKESKSKKKKMRGWGEDGFG